MVELGDVHPATEKLAIRSHLALVCRSLHCADSLVLYLNSPTTSDGTMLLWDANRNGIVSMVQMMGWAWISNPARAEAPRPGSSSRILRRTNLGAQ